MEKSDIGCGAGVEIIRIACLIGCSLAEDGVVVVGATTDIATDTDGVELVGDDVFSFVFSYHADGARERGGVRCVIIIE